MLPAHVLIVGGGLAGPALAIALSARGIKSTIFEIRSGPTNSGGAVVLAPNALKVLDKVIGIKLDNAGFAFENFHLYTDDGSKIGEVQIGDKATTGYGAIRIKRPVLHAILLDKCKEKGIEIHYGETLESIEENDAEVVAVFQSGLRVQGDVLVGADGMHSKVRKHILGTLAPTPVYSGNAGIGGSLPVSSLKTPGNFKFPAMVYTHKGVLLLVPTNPTGDEVGWAAQSPVPERDRAGWEEFGTSGEAARETKDAYKNVPHEPIRSLMDKMDEKSVRVWAPYEIPDLPTWHTKRTCILGDAAHAIPPTGGQGAAQAFEDAGYMARLLSSEQAVKQGYEKLFAHFEKVRKERFAHVRDVTSQSGSTRKDSSSGFAWWTKKVGMRVYFTLKGGVLRDNRITTYDVAAADIVVT